MKGTTNATQQTLFGEILNLRLVTNLSSHEDLIGATVKINSLIYTWDGYDITVEIPAMTTYTIEVSEVEGYRTPEILIINSLTGNINNVTLSYDCELVTINVSDSDGNTLDSSNVTINGIVGNKVPYGEVYTIVANAIDGYRTPASLTYTANLPLRTVDIVYISKFGVFIEDIDGNLYTEALWDGSKTANGIAVLTDNCEFVMALQDAHTTKCEWGSSSIVVSGTLTTDKSVAMADYDGEMQTAAIFSILGNSSSNAPAAYYCGAFTFPNGKKGYLGAAGEWQAALDNKDAISNALVTCGGSAMNKEYWTSTQYSLNTSWYMYWLSEFLNFYHKSVNIYVRAFTTLKSYEEEVVEITFLVAAILFKAKQGMTWMQFITSYYNLLTPENEYSSFRASDGLVYCSYSASEEGKLLLNGQYVSSSDYIVPDAQYNIEYINNYG